MQKKAPIIIVLLLAAAATLLISRKVNQKDAVTIVQEEEVALPVNVIPVEERPFITLTPDAIGRNLSLYIDRLTTSAETLEYELIYQTIEGDQGAFGRINLKTESQPITKSILLGSKSAGGAVTYYPGVSGGSIALTWGATKIKENFNFVTFDPSDPTVSTQDGRLTLVLSAKSLKKGDKIVTMKTSGYPAPIPDSVAKVLAGPYAILTPTSLKSIVRLEIKLPAGEHQNPTVYELIAGKWSKLKTILKNDTLTAIPISNTFIVTSE